MKPEKLHIDIETYSSVDLKKCGVHKYAASPDFEILIVTFGFYYAGFRVYEQYEPMNGKPIPVDRLAWFEDPDVIKYAFNAMFERVCFSAFLGRDLDPEQWRCVMVKCGFAGLPFSLDKVSKILGVSNVKLAGIHLINYFSKPCKPSKANGERNRNLPEHAPEKWKEYCEYNKIDVAAEWDIDEYLDANDIRIPEIEWKYYALDQRVNDRGVKIDRQLVESGIKMADEVKSELLSDIKEITGVQNARSNIQLLQWFKEQGFDIENLQSDTVRNAIINEGPGIIRDVLVLREQASRTSTDKYAAAKECMSAADDRARGLYAFNGASRTGRFAGRRLQTQNLSRIYFSDSPAEIDFARSIVHKGDTNLLRFLYENPIEILSQLIRTIFIAEDNKIFDIADYSAIEARVLAWLAGEEWKLEVFRTHGKIYEATAARMFDVPFESVTKGSDLRQKGKVGELAFGYGGSVGAVDRMGFLKDGTLTIDEVQNMVARWRAENPNIVSMWKVVEAAAISAVANRYKSYEANRCYFCATDNWLHIELPSGRELAYYNPRINENQWGQPALWYEGENDKSQWALIPTYGGKLTENITQAVARDILCDAQYRVDKAGLPIVLHVHDEIGVEVDTLNTELCAIMSTGPAWAMGVPLRAEGFVSKYYKK